MENLKTKNIELDLIKEYKLKPNQNIEMYFFEKYKDDILKIIWYRVNKKFSSLPLEKNDYISYVWIGIKKSLKSYDFDKNMNFKNFLIDRTYSFCLKELKKFTNNSEMIMNYAYSYEDYNNKTKNYIESKSDIEYVKPPIKDMVDDLVASVTKINTKFDNEDIKKVIYLKSIGNSTLEIAKQISKPYRFVKSIVDLAIKIARKIY